MAPQPLSLHLVDSKRCLWHVVSGLHFGSRLAARNEEQQAAPWLAELDDMWARLAETEAARDLPAAPFFALAACVWSEEARAKTSSTASCAVTSRNTQPPAALAND